MTNESAESGASCAQPRRFILERDVDVSGVSGVGVVAEGVEFTDGAAVVRWIAGEHRSTVVWADVASVEAIHGHGGATRIVWLDGRSHGHPATYRAGCRCPECTAAATSSTTKRHKRRNNESRDKATRAGQPWTGPELETVMREDLTASQAAAMLGRTIRAVENARHLCRSEPKYASLAGMSTRAHPVTSSGRPE